MKIQRDSIVLTLFLCGSSMILYGRWFYHYYWGNIILGILTGSFLALLMAMTAYRTERNKALHNLRIQYLKLFDVCSELDKVDNVEKWFDEYCDAVKNLSDAYAEISFLFQTGAKTKYLDGLCEYYTYFKYFAENIFDSDLKNDTNALKEEIIKLSKKVKVKGNSSFQLRDEENGLTNYAPEILSTINGYIYNPVISTFHKKKFDMLMVDKKYFGELDAETERKVKCIVKQIKKNSTVTLPIPMTGCGKERKIDNQLIVTLTKNGYVERVYYERNLIVYKFMLSHYFELKSDVRYYDSRNGSSSLLEDVN